MSLQEESTRTPIFMISVPSFVTATCFERDDSSVSTVKATDLRFGPVLLANCRSPLTTYIRIQVRNRSHSIKKVSLSYKETPTASRKSSIWYLNLSTLSRLFTLDNASASLLTNFRIISAEGEKDKSILGMFSTELQDVDVINSFY